MLDKLKEQFGEGDFSESDTRYTFCFGDENEYELVFEPLIMEDQFYVALYKKTELLTNKVVVKPGFIPSDEKETD